MDPGLDMKDLAPGEVMRFFVAQEVAALRGMIREAPKDDRHDDLAMMDHLLQMVLVLALDLEGVAIERPAPIGDAVRITSVRRRMRSRR